ncbi:Bifunctional F420 biosynthesis protein FbiB [Methylophilaceae bacterium]|nr:Bifunctional F420 biosynthesis protein FbiB [Methylophilaceae bacterium]
MQFPQVEMNIFETILARRSVRSYLPQEVTRKTILSLLEAAVRAPTAMHEEPCAFVIIQNREMLRNLSDRAKPLFIEQARRSAHNVEDISNADFNLFYDAGTLIIICAKSTGPFVEADCWLAAENLMLAACAMNLGTCVIGTALPAMKIPEVKPALGIPDQFEAVVPLILGWPRGETTPTSRKAPHILNTIACLAT